MDAKLNLSDLSALLARRCNMSSAKADLFAKAFFDLISDGMENDGTVKINGLGTFKKVDVASRGSVDVNTGEKIEIKGHSKPVFIPSDGLKDEVNQPFAMFEPVEVSDDYVDTEEPLDGDSAERPEETASVEQSAEQPVEQPAEQQPEETASVEQSVEQPVEQPAEQQPAETASVEQPAEQQPAETASVEQPAEQQPAEIASVEQPAEQPAEIAEQPAGKKTHKGITAILLPLVLLVAIAVAVFLLRNESPSDAPVASVDTIAMQNTVPESAVATLPQPTAVEEQPQEYRFVLVGELEQIPLSAITQKDTLHYVATDTIVLHSVGLDETLTKISLKYYNDKKLWPYIVKYNGLGNFNQLEIGMELAIPKLLPRH